MSEACVLITGCEASVKPGACSDDADKVDDARGEGKDVARRRKEGRLDEEGR